MYMGVTWVSPCPIGLEGHYVHKVDLYIITYHVTIIIIRVNFMYWYIKWIPST